MEQYNSQKFIIFGFIVALLVAIPLTVYYVQKQQEIRSHATAATVLSFLPSSSENSPIQKAVGDTINLDIQVDPGTNQVATVTLNIIYDATKLAVANGTCGKSICPTSDFSDIIGKGATVTNDGTNGSISIEYSTSDITKLIQSPTKVATVTFQALAETTTPTKVSFDTTSQKTFITSTNCQLGVSCPDKPGENVLNTSNLQAAFIVIGPGTATVPTNTPTPTIANQPPICTSLSLDRTGSGGAPFAISFTANGNDPDGTVNKVTFNFGDGPVQDITQTGGVGTNTVSTQVSHTYNNAGTFIATTILTDNRGGTSSATTCTQTITVTSLSPTPIIAATTNTPIPTVVPLEPSPTPQIVSPGPGDSIVGVGIIGVAATIIGAVLFLAL